MLFFYLKRFEARNARKIRELEAALAAAAEVAAAKDAALAAKDAAAAEVAAAKDAALAVQSVGSLQSIVAVLSARPQRAQSVSGSRSVPESEGTEPQAQRELFATQQIDDDDDA